MCIEVMLANSVITTILATILGWLVVAFGLTFQSVREMHDSKSILAAGLCGMVCGIVIAVPSWEQDLILYPIVTLILILISAVLFGSTDEQARVSRVLWSGFMFSIFFFGTGIVELGMNSPDYSNREGADTLGAWWRSVGRLGYQWGLIINNLHPVRC